MQTIYLFCLLSTILLSNVNSFVPKFSTKNQLVFEPFYDDENQKTVLFHSAVFNKMPNFIYSELIQNMNEDNLKVIIPGEKAKIKNLEDDLTVIGHSSGAICALDNCKNKKVKNLILVDPVDNRDSDFDDDEEIDLSNIEKALFIYTKKSYDWSIFPFTIPFIPEKYSLKPDYINIGDNGSKCIIEVSKYGHCDILDRRWADLAHKTIAKGNENREEIYKYHKWLSYVFKTVAFDDIDNIDNLDKKFKNFKIKKSFTKKAKEDELE